MNLSFTPFSKDSTWNGKIAPSSFLYRQLDITYPDEQLTSPGFLDINFSFTFLVSPDFFVPIVDRPDQRFGSEAFRLWAIFILCVSGCVALERCVTAKCCLGAWGPGNTSSKALFSILKAGLKGGLERLVKKRRP